MIPLRDANPTRRRPVVTIGLIAVCVAVFIYEVSLQATSGERSLEQFIFDFGFVPSQLSGALGSTTVDVRSGGVGPAFLGLITSQLLHGGWLHLGGNMLYLWIFGNNVEDRFGRVRFLLFYLAGGVVAGLSQFAIDPTSSSPLIGASGAIAAVLGAYVALFPGARVLSLVFLGFFYQLITIPAVVVLVVWFILQLLSGVGSLGAGSSDAGVAFFAHIGGFVAGVIVGVIVRAAGRGGGPRPAGSPAGFGVG